MFKLVVLSALVAVAVAKPSGVLVHAPVVETYSAPVVAVPAAVSSSYRKDVISKPVVAYSAPAIVETPLVHKVAVAPVIEKVVAAPVATSHSFRSDIISEPVVVAHAAPVHHVAAPVHLAAASVHPW